MIYDISGNELVSDEEKYISDNADVLSSVSSFGELGECAVENNTGLIPDKVYKAFMLGANYKFFSLNNIKSIIDSMETGGLNTLIFCYSNGKGLSFKLNNMTIESYGHTYDLEGCIHTNFGDYYSEQDMAELISYAGQHGVEIIPFFNMPGHFRELLNPNPQFRYNGNDNSLDINNPEARDYAYKIAEMYITWFGNHGIKRWLFGADEFAGLNRGYYDMYAAGNYNYALFLNQIAYVVAQHRMIPLAWNDAFGIGDTLYPLINRKIKVLYWNKQQINGGTASKLNTIGYDLINANYRYYYNASGSAPSISTIRNFNVRSFSDGSSVDPVGACFCAWCTNENPSLDDGGNSITSDLLPLIVAFGETISTQF